MIKRKRISPNLQMPPSLEVGKRGRGRPSTYQKAFARIARNMCAMGATDADLADSFGVSTVCISNWQSKYPEFAEAIREGKVEVFDPKVERALAQRAMGYSVDVEEVKIDKNGNVIRYTTRKHFPPDTTACIFWLKNRKGEQWRDVWKIDHSGKLQYEGMTAEQVLEEIRKEAAELGILPSQLKTLGVAPEPKALPKGNGTKH